jgi:alpha-glucoside transport system substrate-binding protein
MKRRMYALGSIIVLASLIATGCGQATPTAAPTSPPAVVPTPAMAEIDCTGASPGDQLTVMYQWSGAEEEKINAILAPFIEACGVGIVAETTRDAAVLDARVKSTPPDLVFWPSTAPATLYSDQLMDLGQLGVNAANYADYWLELGSFSGKWLAVPVKADIKTIIWYSPVQFEAFGYSVPGTFAELDALVEQMVADGNTPWSMGFESGAATGWTGSDFIQDLMLTLEGPDYVTGIIRGEVPYDDPGVVAAYEQYVEWAADEQYTVGGATGTLNIGFLDAIYRVFSDPPEAMMVKQSGFAGGEVEAQFPDLEYGIDFDFFGFPGAQGVQGGADYLMAFSDSAAARALVTYLTSAEGASAWAKAIFDLSPNLWATGKYTDPQLAAKAAILAGAAGFTPDLGDSIPAPFGEAEWKAIVDSVQGADIAGALAAAAAAQSDGLGQ